MLEKIKLKLLSFYLGMDEKHLAILSTLATFVAAIIAVKTANPYAEIISAKLLNVAIYIISCTSLAALFGTTGLDVKKEIVIEHNMALAVIFLGLYIGLALCVFS